ncbi:MAG: ABC transporter substrate-binding protein [Actinomycetales bacterium]|nr:ABC transporter substrate-binding protein [Actinomycetales bacterium]
MKLQKLTIGVGIAALVAAAIMAPSSANAAGLASSKTVRIGYFANLTHGTAAIARQQKLFEKYLGAGVNVQYTYFTVGTAEIEAIKGGAIDIGFVGPSPAISGYTTTHGQLLNIVSGATTGGAVFVVKPGLISKEGAPTKAEISALAGKNLADPGLGGTQDVALRKYLLDNGLYPNGTPKANIIPLANADTLTQFKLGKIDGAWVPEPWATRLVQEGGAKVFINEASLWKNGQFPTTVVVARKQFLSQYPGSVQAVLKANLDAIKFLSNKANRTDAINQIQAELLAGTGKKLTDAGIGAAFDNVQFSADPIASSAVSSFESAAYLKLLPTGSKVAQLKGLFNLKLLNALLVAQGSPAISVPSEVK